MKRIQILIFTFLILFLPVSWVWGAGPYYVDVDAVNDTGAGTEGDPWKYVPGMASSTNTLAAGDTVYLQKGDTWTEELVLKYDGAVDNRITYDAYGAGAAPILSDGIDFNSDNFECDYVTIQNIAITKSGSHAIEPHNSKGTSIYFINCEIYNAGKCGIRWDADSDTGFFDIKFENCYIHDNNYEAFYCGAGVNRPDNMSITVTNCTITGNCADLTDFGRANCDQITLGGGDDGSTATVEYSYIVAEDATNNGNLLDVLAQNNYIKGNYFDGNGYPESCIKVNADPDASVYIYGNVIYNSKYYGVEISPRVNPTTAIEGPKLYFYNNTVISNPRTGLMNRSSNTLDIRNNIFYDNGTDGGDAWYNANISFRKRAEIQRDYVDPAIITVDYNDYYLTAGQFYIRDDISGVSYNDANWATWVAEGFDANSYRTDPDFVTYPTNCSVNAGSDCINNGADVGDTYLSSLVDTVTYNTDFPATPPIVYTLSQESANSGAGWEIGSYISWEGDPIEGEVVWDADKGAFTLASILGSELVTNGSIADPCTGWDYWESGNDEFYCSSIEHTEDSGKSAKNRSNGGDDGVQTTTAFTTTTGNLYYYTYWVQFKDVTAHKSQWREGDGADWTAIAYTGETADTWTNIKDQYWETSGGASAAVGSTIDNNLSHIYQDDTSVKEIQTEWQRSSTNTVEIDNSVGTGGALYVLGDASDDIGATIYLGSTKGDCDNDLTVTTEYTITFDAKVGTGDSVDVEVFETNEKDSVTVTETDFTEKTLTFTATHATDMLLQFDNLANTEEIWIDNISFSSGAAPTIDAIGIWNNTTSVCDTAATLAVTAADTDVYICYELSEQVTTVSTPESSNGTTDVGTWTWVKQKQDTVSGKHNLVYYRKSVIGDRDLDDQSAEITKNDAVFQDGDDNALDLTGSAGDIGDVSYAVPYPSTSPLIFNDVNTYAVWTGAGGYIIDTDNIEFGGPITDNITFTNDDLTIEFLDDLTGTLAINGDNCTVYDSSRFVSGVITDGGVGNTWTLRSVSGAGIGGGSGICFGIGNFGSRLTSDDTP